MEGILGQFILQIRKHKSNRVVTCYTASLYWDSRVPRGTGPIREKLYLKVGGLKAVRSACWQLRLLMEQNQQGGHNFLLESDAKKERTRREGNTHGNSAQLAESRQELRETD